MAKGLAALLLTVGLASLPAAAAAGNLQRGEALHRANCVTCHAAIVGGDGTYIYTRPDRRVQSLNALQAQVDRCKDSLGFAWPPHDIRDVVTFLNERYYRFEQGGD